MNDITLVRWLADWALLHPWALVLAALTPALVLLAVSELAGWGRGEPIEDLELPPVPDQAPTAAPLEAAAPAPAQQLELLETEPAGPPEPVAAPEPLPAPETEPAPVALEAPPKLRLGERLRHTRESLVGRLGDLMGGRKLDAELMNELEDLLFSSDLGVATADALMEKVRRQGAGADADTVRAVLREEILAKLLTVEAGGIEIVASPHVILVLGVNGSGKTTTIGKLAARHRAAGRSVILGAGDTFRAAAREQLAVWGERTGCDVIMGPEGGDPSAVAFDTVKAAVARRIDVAIIDTAGRLQTKKPLMEELGKMARVIGRDLEGAPHETLLVLDANTGQNAISQAELFTQAAGVSGMVLTKLDGTAKGGVIIGLADKFGIPVRFVGVGEALEDLQDFSAREFVDALFEDS